MNLSKIRSKVQSRYLLVLIILLSGFLRFYGVLWDNGYHFHPDERMLIMVTDRIRMFTQLNPDFFNYGSLPIYLLRAVSQIIDKFGLSSASVSNYDGMLIVGRILSSTFDLVTLIFVYLLAKLLFNEKKIAVIAAFVYGVSFFPIQNSHFFISDIFLTTFSIAILYLLLKYIRRPTIMKSIAIGLLLAASLTTKISALLFFPTVALTFMLPILSNHSKHKRFKYVGFGLLTVIVLCVASFIFMPYAFVEYKRFFADISVQLKMNSNPYIFPYTLQYVGSLPYLYYIKNIAFWGLGPLLFGFVMVFMVETVLSTSWKTFFVKLKNHDQHILQIILVVIYYLVFFLVLGRSAVKFMRYLLPIYPILAVMAGSGIWTAIQAFKSNYRPVVSLVIVTLVIVWTDMFVNIYSVSNTRLRATDYILKAIPEGSTIAVEHWDDRLPVFQSEKFEIAELQLYNLPDNENKWQIINAKLKESDYIIIASNRLYVPLTRLVDCSKYKQCYPKTAKYYDELFSGKSDFKKIAEFTSYPSISVRGQRLEIIDDTADESFTVYDHPKIMIFQKKSVYERGKN